MRGAPTNSTGFVNVGTGTMLPLDPFGLPGCTAMTKVDQFIGPFGTDAGGFADSGPIRVPTDPVAMGIELVGQWVVVDATANAFGAVLSNGVALRIGN